MAGAKRGGTNLSDHCTLKCPAIHMMAETQKKADAMRRKTTEFHRMFTAGESESVIQDYSCMLNSALGRMYISQNIIGYNCGFPARTEKIPFARISSIVKDRGTLFSGVSITYEKGTETAKLLFTNFSHRDEVFELLVYLWQNPPSYVSAATTEEDAVDSGKLGEITIGRTTVGRGPGMTGSGSWGDPLASSSPSLAGPGGNPRAVSMYGAVPVNGSGATFGQQPSYGSNQNAPGNPFGQSSSSSAVNGQMQAQAMAQQEARVDVEKAREALRIAYSTRDVTADTINKIEQQGQQLVRMEAHLDNMSSNLDQSEHLIKGMESVFYYIGNKMKKNGQAAPPVVDYGNRALKVEKQQPPLDIEILCKNPDDSFSPALLRFHSLGFACVDAVTGKPLNPSYTWPYADVQQLVLRARHEHLDVKFTASSAKERFRLMSSYIQLIVNEIIIRKPEANDIPVVFEPGVKQFEYGNPALSKIPTASRVATSSGFSRPEALHGQKTSALLSAQADQQTRDDLDEVDRHMDEVSRVVGDIGDMALAMNSELGAQIAHIDRIDRKVTDNNDRIIVHTDRMNKLMS